MMNTTHSTYMTDLSRQLGKHFDLDEVKELVLQLGLDYEDFPHDRRPALVREFTLTLLRSNRLQELVDAARMARPSIEWPDVPKDLALLEPNSSPEAPATGTQATYDQSGQSVDGPQLNANEITVDHLGDKNTFNNYYSTPAPRPEKPHLPFEPVTVAVAGGSFQMNGVPVEGPPGETAVPYDITLPDFRIGRRPVTNAQYYQYLRRTQQIAPTELYWEKGTSPSVAQNDEPVTGVTWHEALNYCQWLAEESGRPYTLPSEVQWEWAGQAEAADVQFVADLREWTTTVWGEAKRVPDALYLSPWQPNDGRDDISEGNHIRRVTRSVTTQHRQRSSELPDRRGLLGQRIGFRVAIGPQQEV